MLQTFKTMFLQHVIHLVTLRRSLAFALYTNYHFKTFFKILTPTFARCRVASDHFFPSTFYCYLLILPKFSAIHKSFEPPPRSFPSLADLLPCDIILIYIQFHESSWPTFKRGQKQFSLGCIVDAVRFREEVVHSETNGRSVDAERREIAFIMLKTAEQTELVA